MIWPKKVLSEMRRSCPKNCAIKRSDRVVLLVRQHVIPVEQSSLNSPFVIRIMFTSASSLFKTIILLPSGSIGPPPTRRSCGRYWNANI